jgi:hypothetical protein
MVLSFTTLSQSNAVRRECARCYPPAPQLIRTVGQAASGDRSDAETVRKLFAIIHLEIVFHLASEVMGRRENEYRLADLERKSVEFGQRSDSCHEQQCNNHHGRFAGRARCAGDECNSMLTVRGGGMGCQRLCAHVPRPLWHPGSNCQTYVAYGRVRWF